MAREIVFLLWLFGLLSIGMVPVVYGTVARNRWGINLDPISDCPSCGARVRKSKSLQQILWGGATCGACGTEWNKWGTVLVNPQI